MSFLSRWRIQAGLVLAVVPAMFLFVSTSAQQPAPTQQPSAPAAGAPAPGGRGGARAGGAPTTTANMTGNGGFVDSADLMVRRINFEAGARTYWHTHDVGQILVPQRDQPAPHPPPRQPRQPCQLRGGARAVHGE